METKHTKTPWRQCKKLPAYIENGEGEIIALTLSVQERDEPVSRKHADAEFIVHAVNAHKKYCRLHDMLSDMIEGGRLRETDIPDDYQALVSVLTDLVKLENN